ncbi:hypothetical protein [Kordia sp.]|uniref:hypothetical protein n=1 Tax=Kordia sp. TaxID=1965332 RepID=UPI003D27FC73
MKTDLLRHTEIFIFIAMVFSIYTAALLEDQGIMKKQIEIYQNNTLPHIEIDGTQDYYFKSGQSIIRKDFESYLKDSLVPKLVSDLENCIKCNTIYIIGHTDDINANKHKNKSFDENILEVIKDSTEIINFKYNSNTDLGLLRAMSIYQHLRKYKELNQIKYWFPYSAGPFIHPINSKLIQRLDVSNDDYNQKKRRIELWLYAYKPKNED